ncbi:CBL-interacting serine/threonine-protein kinase 11 [Tritrichomonas foetus]|uniref:CBL-interacting serine/threonine-protein kinase 11 n=1 Tax=Tritrichomonas foetus TaxID=1144522 RepID=A0A1J4JC03_9EUKA|nr:CBL-interacting serine/threonine-protein kinase 11 [Tritrichomonas foetus]|eukprot:OHS96718.1 CBL-interacting serine/threonine-protein kinase 11 [Tritrichomonas foetus]
MSTIGSEKLSVHCPSRIGKYILHETIGHGAYAIVKRATCSVTGRKYACKVISKKRLATERSNMFFEQEIRILQQLNHPDIIHLYDLLKDSLNYYVIMEYCPNGELYSKITTQKKIPEKSAKIYFWQILEAVKYIHIQNVAHRDIKPENVLIDADGNVKLSDFGLSKFIRSDNDLTSTFCGSPCYMAPEVIKSEEYNPKVSDIWSCGVLLYTMVAGTLPWINRNKVLLYEQIKNGDYFMPKGVSDTCTDLISRMMDVNVDTRITVDEALKHPFIIDRVPIHTSDAHMQLVSIKKIDKFFEREFSDIDLINLDSNEIDFKSTNGYENSFEKVERIIHGNKRRKPSVSMSLPRLNKCDTVCIKKNPCENRNVMLEKLNFDNSITDILNTVRSAKIRRRKCNVVKPKVRSSMYVF